MYAAEKCHEGCLRLLIEAGADLQALLQHQDKVRNVCESYVSGAEEASWKCDWADQAGQ